MRTENIVSSSPQCSKYVKTSLVVMGLVALSASAYVAWPALAHIGTKLV